MKKKVASNCNLKSAVTSEKNPKIYQNGNNTDLGNAHFFTL